MNTYKLHPPLSVAYSCFLCHICSTSSLRARVRKIKTENIFLAVKIRYRQKHSNLFKNSFVLFVLFCFTQNSAKATFKALFL